MRIALVAPFGLRAKGTARARALPLARALARCGHQVALFIPPYDSPEDAGRSWTEDQVEVVNVALPGVFKDTLFWHFQLSWRLLRRVVGWRADVVHVFKPKGPSGLVGAALWLASRTPALVYRAPSLVVDADDWEGAGGWNDDPRAGYSPVQRRFFGWQERFGLTHAGAWTVASRCLRERAVGFGADPARVYHLPNGVGASGLACTSGMPSEEASLAVCRRSVLLYTRFAGVRAGEVADIWQRVVRMRPEARLTIVGRGLAGEENELSRLAPNVEVVGWLEPPAIPALFARMNVAIVPWSNTPANQARHSAKVLELMAAGLPTVAYAVGELPVTLAEGGLLIAPGEADSFAGAVVALLDDPVRAAAVGKAARNWVQEHYTWDRLASSALLAYAEAQAHRANAGRGA